jgi:hypothetical protein
MQMSIGIVDRRLIYCGSSGVRFQIDQSIESMSEPVSFHFGALHLILASAARLITHSCCARTAQARPRREEGLKESEGRFRSLRSNYWASEHSNGHSILSNTTAPQYQYR